MQVSWHHSQSRHWHQLGLILAHWQLLQSVHHIASMHSADFDRYHAKSDSPSQQDQRAIKKNKEHIPKMESCNIGDSGLIEWFKDGVLEAFEAPSANDTTSCDKWSKLRDTLKQVGKGISGQSSKDWSSLWQNGISDRPSSTHPTQWMKNGLANVQQILRETQRKFCNNVCGRCDDLGDIAGVQAALKSVLRPLSRETAHLKNSNGNILLEKPDQLKCWVDLFTATLYFLINPRCAA